MSVLLSDRKEPEYGDVKIVLGTKIERARELHDGNFQVSFRLMPYPEVPWKLSFSMVWMRFFAKQTKRTANIEKDLLLVECQLTELKELYPNLLWAVEAANHAEVERLTRELHKEREAEERRHAANTQIERVQEELRRLG
jgi:hypothetical protein